MRESALGTWFRDSACDSDPHRGAFKNACDSCHTTSGSKTMLAGFDLNHSKTKYPLLGKHAQVSCVACHVAISAGLR